MEMREKEILKRSEFLFKTRGFKGVTMDDIARDMGMSKKTVYKYFRNKKDLILQNIETRINSEKSRFCELEKNSEDAVEEMIQLIHHVTRMFDDTKPILFEELKRFYPGSWKVLDAFLKRHVYQRIFDNIQRGKHEGLYRLNIDADFVAKMYVSQVRSIMMEELFPKSKYKKSDLFIKLIEYHIRGIANERGKHLFDHYINLELNFN
jgi:AcrR family transcriptional regulator